MVKNKEKIDRLRSYLMYLYGEKEGRQRCGNLMRTPSLKVLQFKFGKEDGKKRYEELIEICKYKNTLPSFIKKYGEELGKEKYYEKNRKLSVSIESLKRNGYSDEEIKKIRKKHSEGSKTDLESMVNKYGEKEGKRRYDSKMENFFTHWDYKLVMEKYNMSEKEAKNYVKKVQKRDLEYYVKKYGKKIGQEKYDEANRKRAYANTEKYYIEKYGKKIGKIKFKEINKERGKSGRLSYYIEKYGKEIGKKKYDEVMRKKTAYFPNYSSLIELEFNQSIYERLDENQKKLFYGSPIKKPYFINVSSEEYGVSCVVPDIKIGNVIIEFDGHYWHSLDNIKEKDNLKDKIYKDNSYYIIRISETEYLENKNILIENTIKLINDKISKK